MNKTKIAAFLFVLYGIYVTIILAMVLHLGPVDSWYDNLKLIAPIVLIVGSCLLIARGLLHLNRWSWWAGIAVSALASISGLRRLVLGTFPETGEGIFPTVISYGLRFGSAILLLAAGVLLLLPSSRAAFRKRLMPH